MKEIFRFTSFQKPDPTNPPCGKIDLSQIKADAYLKAIGAKDPKERLEVVKSFIANGLNTKPLNIDKDITYIYTNLPARKKLTIEELEKLCKSSSGKSINDFLVTDGFNKAKNTIVENLYFLSQARIKAHADVKVLYKHLLRVIGLLEAIAKKDPCLGKILGNPSLQYYFFEQTVREQQVVEKKERIDPGKEKVKTSLKSAYAHIVDLHVAAAELLNLHEALKSEFSSRQDLLEEKLAQTPYKKKKEGILSKLGMVNSSVDEEEAEEGTDFEDEPRMANEADLSAKTGDILKGLGVRIESFDPFDTINTVHEAIILRGNQLNSMLSRQEQVLYQGKRISTRYVNKLGDLGINKESIELFGNWVDNEPMFDVSPDQPPVPAEFGFAKVLGEGKLLKVEEKFKGCVLGSVSNVLNIPAGSKKELTDRYLVKRVDISESQSASTTSEENATQSGDKTSMTSESEKVQKMDLSLEAGVNVSASYGPTIGIEASSDFSSSISSSEISKSALSYAKDVTSRAVKRIEQKIASLQRVERTSENETTHLEAYENATAAHMVGIYQWLNEVYEAKLVQYDARLMLEFMIPEPGSLLMYAKSTPAPSSEVLVEPIFDLTPREIEPETYLEAVARYGAVDVSAPPAPTHTLTKAFSILETAKDGDRLNFAFKDDSITIPDGYRADWIKALIAASRPQKEDANAVTVTICHKGYTFNDPRRNKEPKASARRKKFNFDVKSNYRNIPIALTGFQDRSFTFTVTVKCLRTAEALEQWRLDTFEKLRQGYLRQMDEYREKQAAARQRALYFGSSGSNPDENRRIEKDELKRACISILTGQEFELFDSVNDPGNRIPRIIFEQVKPEGDYVRFFETAFEWTQLTYVLYPYFWANPAKTWLRSLNLGLEDKKHEEFLKSGYARVVVPVRPEFQAAILQYLESGTIWDGRHPDDIDLNDPLYVQISTEIMEKQGRLQQAMEVLDTWEYTIPTSLQVISNGTNLPSPPFV